MFLYIFELDEPNWFALKTRARLIERTLVTKELGWRYELSKILEMAIVELTGYSALA